MKKICLKFFPSVSQDKISTSVHCATHITNACGHEPKQHRFLTYYSQILYIKIHRFRVKQVLLMPEQCPNLRHLCRHVMFNVSEHTKLVKGFKSGIEQTSQTPVTAQQDSKLSTILASSVQYAFWIVNPKFLTFTVFQNLTKMLGFAVHSPLGFKKLTLKCN